LEYRQVGTPAQVVLPHDPRPPVELPALGEHRREHDVENLPEVNRGARCREE
jgi:hypothetical protein